MSGIYGVIFRFSLDLGYDTLYIDWTVVRTMPVGFGALGWGRSNDKVVAMDLERNEECQSTISCQSDVLHCYNHHITVLQQILKNVHAKILFIIGTSDILISHHLIFNLCIDYPNFVRYM